MLPYSGRCSCCCYEPGWSSQLAAVPATPVHHLCCCLPAGAARVSVFHPSRLGPLSVPSAAAPPDSALRAGAHERAERRAMLDPASAATWGHDLFHEHDQAPTPVRGEPPRLWTRPCRKLLYGAF